MLDPDNDSLGDDGSSADRERAIDSTDLVVVLAENLKALWKEHNIAKQDLAATKRRLAQYTYNASSVSNQSNDFVLYRILGNDLPPRHCSGQTLANLRFILEYEPRHPNCTRRWVINRIIDPDMKQEVEELLISNDELYDVIVFDPTVYSGQPWSIEGFIGDELLYSAEFNRHPARELILDAVYNEKILYAINNNGARNYALDDGRGRAK